MLRVVKSPGCAAILTVVELGLKDGEILIDAGKIAESLGYEPTDPDANKALIRVALRARGVAILAATEAGISGVVRTSNPRSAERIAEQLGTTVREVPMTQAEACRRIRKLYPNNRDRQILCELGVSRYFENEQRIASIPS